MKQLIKKQFILLILLGLFIIPTSQPIAMMGGGSGGGMGGHMGGGLGWDRQGSQYNREPMSPTTAENHVREYMNRRTSEPYKLGNLKDGGTYYMAEVLHQDGELIERLLIDKQSGRIHSLR